MLPIGEKDLLEPRQHWPGMVQIEDSLRLEFLTSFGYADSTGEVPSDVDAFEMANCEYPYGEVPGLNMYFILVRGKDGDRDENVWLVTKKDNSIVARSLIAELQTTCSSTYLRGCAWGADGTLIIQHLKHSFDCDTDEFIGTEILPSFSIQFLGNGMLNDVIQASPQQSDTEIPSGP